MISGHHYSIKKEGVYFLTCTVTDWIDVFTRKNHKKAIVESLLFCQKNKGLRISAWCLMPSHLHLLCWTDEGHILSDTIRDFKKFTSKKIVSQIQNEPECRREWLLERFSFRARMNNKVSNFKFWQDENHAIEIFSPHVAWQKIMYIHENPVKEGFVKRSWHYLFSSASAYRGENGMLDIIIPIPELITVNHPNFYKVD